VNVCVNVCVCVYVCVCVCVYVFRVLCCAPTCRCTCLSVSGRCYRCAVLQNLDELFECGDFCAIDKSPLLYTSSLWVVTPADALTVSATSSTPVCVCGCVRSRVCVAWVHVFCDLHHMQCSGTCVMFWRMPCACRASRTRHGVFGSESSSVQRCHRRCSSRRTRVSTRDSYPLCTSRWSGHRCSTRTAACSTRATWGATVRGYTGCRSFTTSIISSSTKRHVFFFAMPCRVLSCTVVYSRMLSCVASGRVLCRV
jgi:hypothetical protein